MRTCDCNSMNQNTGTGNCKNLMAVPRKLILVPTYDSTGVRNKIASGDALNAAYFTAKVNNVDPSKRWYPTPLIDNIEDVRADPIMETLASQKKLYVQQGIRSFKGLMVEMSNVLIEKLQSFQCSDFSAYIIDKERTLIGSYDGTDLYPILIDKDTFFTLLMKTTDTTVQKVSINFEYSRIELDEDLRTITETEAGTNLLLLNGLLDVNVASSSPATTGFVLKLTTDYGTFKTPINVVGWVASDFVLYNNTDDPTHASPITKTVVELPNGTYTFLFAAQTGSDVIEISATKTGYDFPTTKVTL